MFVGIHKSLISFFRKLISLYLKIRLEYLLLRTYRKPKIRTRECLKFADALALKYSEERKMHFLHYAARFMDQSVVKRVSYQYSNSVINPLFKNEKGHASLLEYEYFDQVSAQLNRYLEPFSKTWAGRWVRWQQKNSTDVVPTAGSSNKIKVLFFIRSWSFIEELIDHLKKDIRFEVDTYDFRIYENALDKLNSDDPRNFDTKLHHLLFSYGPNGPQRKNVWKTAIELSPELGEKVSNADVVFVDWMNYPTVWASRYLPDNVKLISRCHSHEVFTRFPLTTNFARIDHLIFVAEPIRCIFNSLFGNMLEPKRLSVIANLRDLQCFFDVETSCDDRWWRVGILKYSTATKGPLFALEVIALLRKRDKRWKLVLGGPDFPDKNSDLCVSFFKYIENNNLSDALIIDGYIDDVPAWFSSVGYVLSASEREGTHEAVLEGMASGCIPALRNWPMVKNFGGAREVYDGWPVFDEPCQLADWIAESQVKQEELSHKALEFAKNKDISVLFDQMKKVIEDTVR